jgi:hypothetical protein
MNYPKINQNLIKHDFHQLKGQNHTQLNYIMLVIHKELFFL